MRVGAAIREQVRAAFLALGTTPEGRALLEKIPMDQVAPAQAEDFTPMMRMGLEKFYVPN